MTCAYCGLTFDELKASRGGCSSCFKHSHASGCGMIKCPQCGYDTPTVPKWVNSLTAFIRKGGALLWGK